MKLFKVIFLLMLAVGVVSTATVGLLVLSDTRELLTRDAQELSGERVKQLRLKTERDLEEPVRAVLQLSRTQGFFTLPLAEQRALVTSVLTQRRDVTAITAFDAQKARVPGLQAFAFNDVPPTEVAEHEARARALLEGLGGLRYAPPVARPGRPPTVTVAFPVGEPARGYLAAELSLASLAATVEDQRVGSSGFAYLVDGQGKLVAGPRGRFVAGEDLSARPAVASLLATLAKSPDPELFRVGNFGTGDERVVAAYASVAGPGWAVVSEQPLDAAYTQVRSMQHRIVVGFLAALAVALLLALLFSRGLTRPLKRFVASALDIARGRFGSQVELRSNNELGELARTFNHMSKELLRYDQENKGLYQSLEQGYLETILALANSIDSKDPYTRGHSQRVGDISSAIGRELGLPEPEVKLLRYAGILHDIGKIGIVDTILGKQEQLTKEEMTVMREHPVIGASIVEPVTFLGAARAAVKSHHEKWNGTGYPEGLSGEGIPLVARIVGCADTWDACTTTRPYQRAMSIPAALEIMERLRGTALDPAVVDALRRVLGRRAAGAEASPLPVQLAS
ncbi:MAG: HD domain-containing phosphohydrolase [Myxococcaceae bacterium]